MEELKVVQLISGGMDSTVLAYDLASQGQLAALLSVNYNQIHKKELVYSAVTSRTLGVPHHIIDLSSANVLLKGSALTDTSVQVPHGSYEEESMKATVVPNRNAILLSLAYAWAISLKANAVAFAAHAGDHAVYPDCRQPFVSALETALNRGNEWDGFKRILSPYVHMTKAQIVTRGLELSVPFRHTWTCYGNGEIPCGRCGTCTERLEAFHLAGAQDPWDYEDREFWRSALGYGTSSEAPDSNAATTEARWALGGGE